MDWFLPSYLADMVLAYANMVHHQVEIHFLPLCSHVSLARATFSAMLFATMCHVLQVDGFLPSYLADMVSAYANMVHHPGPLIDHMTQRMLPNLHIMEAGDAPALWALHCFCMH